MRHLRSKRTALLAVIGVLSLSAVAFAYFSSTGGGSGDASASIAAGTVAATSNTTDVFNKIGDTATFTVNVTNGGTSAVWAAIDTVDAVSKNGACPDASWTIGTVVNAAKSIAASGSGAIGTVPVTLTETNSLQDACRDGVSLVVTTK